MNNGVINSINTKRERIFSLEVSDEQIKERITRTLIRFFGAYEDTGDCLYFETALADTDLAKRYVSRLAKLLN